MRKGSSRLIRVIKVFCLLYLAFGSVCVFITIGLGQQFRVDILQPKAETKLNRGEIIVIEVTLSPSLPPEKQLFMTAVFQVDKEVIDRVPLYDDGDSEHFDRTAKDGIFSNGYIPRRTGNLEMRVRAYWNNTEIWSEPISIVVLEPKLTEQGTTPTGIPPAVQPPKPTRPLGVILTILGFSLLGGSIFMLRRTIQPQGGLGLELRFIGKREALLVGPRGMGDITVPEARFADLKLAKICWVGLNGLIVQPLQAKSVLVEETKGQRLREGFNHIKISHTIQGVPISREVIINMERFADENRTAIGLSLLGAVSFFAGILLLFS